MRIKRKDTQSCSKKSFLESHPHWMQLWNVTVENAKMRASSSSKVSPGWNARGWSNGESLVTEVVIGMVVVVEPLFGSPRKG